MRNLHPRARLQLPGDPAEQVRAHRHVPVGEVQCIGGVVAVRIGEGLQVDVGGRDAFDSLDQRIEVAPLLRRVRVVHIIQVDLQRADAVERNVAPQLVGQALHGRVVADQEARQPMQVAGHWRAAAFQIEGHRHAQLFGDVVAQLVVGRVRPDDGARAHAQVLLDALHAAAEIGAQALLVLRLALVAARGRPVDAGDHRWRRIALRIGKHSVVQVVGMAGHFDQAAVVHLLQLRPGNEVIVAERPVAIVDRAPGCHVHVIGDHCHQRRVAVRLQQRERLVVDAAQAIIEGQQYRFGGSVARPWEASITCDSDTGW